jgi:hypothetical protein
MALIIAKRSPEPAERASRFPSRTLTAIASPAGTVAASLQRQRHPSPRSPAPRSRSTRRPRARRAPPRHREGCEVYVPVEGVVDIEAERGRPSRELVGSTRISAASRPSSPEDFRQRAPAEWWPEEARRRRAGAPGEAREGLAAGCWPPAESPLDVELTRSPLPARRAHCRLPGRTPPAMTQTVARVVGRRARGPWSWPTTERGTAGGERWTAPPEPRSCSR